MARIAHILFDLGGVVLRAKKQMTPLVMSLAFKLPVEVTQSLYQTTVGNWRIGKITGKECIARIKFQYNLKESPEELIHRYTQAYAQLSEIDEDMTRLIDRLRSGYTVSAFSNMVDIHVEVNEQRGVYSHFDYVFVSCKMGCAKPDPSAYAFVVQALKTDPSECLFIDDTMDNIRAAQTFGMKTYAFDCRENVEDFLRKELVYS